MQGRKGSPSPTLGLEAGMSEMASIDYLNAVDDLRIGAQTQIASFTARVMVPSLRSAVPPCAHGMGVPYGPCGSLALVSRGVVASVPAAHFS